MDESDSGAVHTAVSLYSASLFLVLLTLSACACVTQYREANEEVALPLDSPHVHTLCTLEPFVSQFKVVVMPVVAYLDDVSVLEALRAEPSEVARIFDHPLEALLDPKLAREEGLVPIGCEDWPYEDELHVRLSPVSSFITFFSLFFLRPFVVVYDFWFLGASRIMPRVIIT